MIDVGGPATPIVGGATSARVVLGGLKRQAEQALSSSVPPWPLLQFILSHDGLQAVSQKGGKTTTFPAKVAFSYSVDPCNTRQTQTPALRGERKSRQQSALFRINPKHKKVFKKKISG